MQISHHGIMVWKVIKMLLFLIGVTVLWHMGVLETAYDMLNDVLLGIVRSIQGILTSIIP